MSLHVDRLKEYRVAYRGLKEGIHTWEYTLDKMFFNCFEATAGTEGEVRCLVKITKSALLMQIDVTMRGEIRTTCDRCLEEMMLPVEGELNLIVKEGEREEGNEDDYIVLTPEEDYLDLSIPLYETYMLHYPLRVIHPEGECNEEMEQLLKKQLVDEENKIDPRWDELRKLINN